MKLNKYLEELEYKIEELPGNYDENNPLLSDPRNKEDEEGFCPREFFDLDHTLDLFIYSKLCYFREHYATIATPSCFCDNNGNTNNKKWLKTLDRIIKGFKISLSKNMIIYTEEEQRDIAVARKLLIKYWDCLWY